MNSPEPARFTCASLGLILSRRRTGSIGPWWVAFCRTLGWDSPLGTAPDHSTNAGGPGRNNGRKSSCSPAACRRMRGSVAEFPGASTVYLRLAWSYIEPEENRFNWAVVDTPAQRWIAKGKKIALRFTSSETDRDQPYATPEWVRKAGAKGYFYSYGKGIDPQGTNWEPDYDDPIFLGRLEHFLATAGARYDGNPTATSPMPRQSGYGRQAPR